jgi:hypothetical protein
MHTLRSAYDGGSQVSAQFLYRFPSEAAASDAFGLLVAQLQAEVPEKGWRLAFWLESIPHGLSVYREFRREYGTPRELTLDRAMRRAWAALIEARIEPPGMALGNVIGAIETAALIYAIEHMLPPGVAQAAREVLKAAGVKVPDPGTLVAQGASRFLMGVFLKRWGPLVGSAILVATVVLQAFGQTQIAQALTSIGGFLPSTDGGITAGELAAAIAAGTGLFLKIKALIKAAQTP